MPRCSAEEPALREVALRHLVACHLYDDRAFGAVIDDDAMSAPTPSQSP
jgi:hypothetical protein